MPPTLNKLKTSLTFCVKRFSGIISAAGFHTADDAYIRTCFYRHHEPGVPMV